MTKTLAQAREYAERLASVTWSDRLQPFVIPSFTSIAAVADELGPRSHVLVGAQDGHWEDAGAWTGEVSMAQVTDAGARLVEIGHSERREFFGDTDERVNLKVLAALRNGLLPLVCVGEDAEHRRAGGAVDVVRAQLLAALADVPQDATVLVAYEPVWAIGENGTPASPDDVVDVIRELAQIAGPGRPILYGGSVNQSNAADLLSVPEVSGLFVGRAAWHVEGFLELADLAASSQA